MAFDFMLICLGVLMLSAAAFVLFLTFRACRGGPIPGTGLIMQGDRLRDAQDLQKELDAVRRDALAQLSDEDEEEDPAPEDDIIAEGGVLRNCGFSPVFDEGQEE